MCQKLKLHFTASYIRIEPLTMIQFMWNENSTFFTLKFSGMTYRVNLNRIFNTRQLFFDFKCFFILLFPMYFLGTEYDYMNASET